MKKNILITLLAALLLSSCGEYNKLLKSTDYEYKYEAAKNYFAKGQYNRAATLLNELIAILKGTDYYNMGNYLGNNYQACVITAQNALKDYPYTNLREDLSILILRAKYELAVYSVEDKRAERYREAVDECYAFKNEFPESKYMKEVDRIFKEAQKMLGEGSEEQ